MTKEFENAIKIVKPDGTYKNSIIPSAYDISTSDMAELIELAMSKSIDARWRAIAMAFEFGFVMGNRCTHRRKLRRL